MKKKILSMLMVLALMLGMDGETLLRAIGSLVLGTPALVAFGTVGAAVTVGLKRGGLVAPVLVLPLSLPVLIFGTGAIAPLVPGASGQALLLLAALGLVSVVLVPFAAAMALRFAGE